MLKVAQQNTIPFNNLTKNTNYQLLIEGHSRKRKNAEKRSRYRRSDSEQLESNSDKQLGWNCFDIAINLANNLGITTSAPEERAKQARAELVRRALEHSNDIEYRNLLAPEIREAAVLTVDAMKNDNPTLIDNNYLLPLSMRNSDLTDLYDNYHNAENDEQVIAAVATCNDRLGNLDGRRKPLSDLKEYFQDPDNRQAHPEAYQAFNQAQQIVKPAEEAFSKYFSQESIYLQYILDHYGKNEWFAFQRQTSERFTSMVDVTAKLLGFKIIIYEERQKRIICQTAAYGREILVKFNGVDHFTVGSASELSRILNEEHPIHSKPLIPNIPIEKQARSSPLEGIQSQDKPIDRLASYPAQPSATNSQQERAIPHTSQSDNRVNRQVPTGTQPEKDPQSAQQSGNRQADNEANQPPTDPERSDNMEPPKKKPRIYAKDNFYSKEGLVHSLHGNIYQLKLQMLFLKRALKNNYLFNLGTENKNAEKFDDIVFKYRIDKKDKIRFLQAKHKQDESKKITANDLLTERDKDFSLQKYFISYRKINENPEFINAEKYFIICTNINLDDDDLKKNQIDFEKKSIAVGDILKVENLSNSNKVTKHYKLSINKQHALYEKLKETSDLYLLVKKLLNVLGSKKNEKLELRDKIFQLYHTTLIEKNVMDKEKSRFHNDFIKGNGLFENDEIASNFRRVFFDGFKEIISPSSTDKHIQERLEQKELKISNHFGEKFQIDKNPQLYEEEAFIEEFVELINNSKDKTVVIEKKNYRKNAKELKKRAIAENIWTKNRLSVNILVSAKESNKIIFRSDFFDDSGNYQLSDDQKKFKSDFKENLKKKLLDIDFDDLKDYKFEIKDFNTLEEGQEEPKLEFPNDKIDDVEISNFFGDLVFYVNYPNEEDLGEIIKKELGEDSQFNLLDADLVADCFQREMLDWFKKKSKEKGKEGVFLNKETGQYYFNSIERKLDNLISVGLCLSYSEKLASYDIQFNKDISIKEFLLPTTKEKILHITHLSEKTRLSAIRVNNFLINLKKSPDNYPKLKNYVKQDGSIFISLNKLLLSGIQTRVINSFTSKINYNLLIIDCKSVIKKQNIQELYNRLSGILNKNKENIKKIILIANKNNPLADKFKNDSEHKDRYKCLKDETSFNDLEHSSKRTLLKKTIINFQGSNIALNELIRLDSNTELLPLADLLDNNLKINDEPIHVADLQTAYAVRQNKKISSPDLVEALDESLTKKNNLFVISGLNAETLEQRREEINKLLFLNDDKQREKMQTQKTE